MFTDTWYLKYFVAGGQMFYSNKNWTKSKVLEKIMLDLHLLNGQKKKIWIWIL